MGKYDRLLYIEELKEVQVDVTRIIFKLLVIEQTVPGLEGIRGLDINFDIIYKELFKIKNELDRIQEEVRKEQGEDPILAEIRLAMSRVIDDNGLQGFVEEYRRDEDEDGTECI